MSALVANAVAAKDVKRPMGVSKIMKPMRLMCIYAVISSLGMQAAEIDPSDEGHIPPAREQAVDQGDAGKIERLRKELEENQRREAALQEELEVAEMERARRRQLAELQRDTAVRLEELQRDLNEIREQGQGDAFHKAYTEHLETMIAFDRRIQAMQNVSQIPVIHQELYRRQRQEMRWEQVTAYGLRWQAEVRALKKHARGKDQLLQQIKQLEQAVAALLKQKEAHLDQGADIHRAQETLEKQFEQLHQSLDEK